MYCVSVAYPQQSGGTFDFDYYINNHIPMVAGFLPNSLSKTEVRKGAQSPDGSAPSYVCLANIWIHSTGEFEAALAEHGKEIMGDVPNFTNIEPILQIDEVVA
jgi:uncharacterized protein (TIGR02118 family)